MAIADTTKPFLTSLSFPTSVDVTGGGTSLTFSVGASDAGLGVDYVYVSFDKSWQSGSGRAAEFIAYDSTDSFADGLSSRQYYIDDSSSAGIYTVSSVSVYDKAGNYTIYYAWDLAAAGIQTSFEIKSNEAADTTKPFLTSLSFPTSVDVTGGGTSLTFSVGASDAGLGVDYVYVSFDKSWQSGSGRAAEFIAYDSTDSFADGLSSRQYHIDASSGAGTYSISSVAVYDKAGNYTIYYAWDLAAAGIQTSFEIKSNEVADTTKPFLTSLSFPTSVDVTGGGTSLTFSVVANDRGLGVDYVYVSFDKSWQSGSGRAAEFIAYDSTDSFADGLSSRQYYIDDSSGAGTYTVSSVSVYDKAGNYTVYYPWDLAAAGIQTSFQIIDRNAGVSADVAVAGSVGEGTGTALTPVLTLHDIASYTGTVTFAFDAAHSTVSVDEINVPTFAGSYSVSQSPAGDYVIDLPEIDVFDDLLIEGDEILAFKVTASGQIFSSGTDSQIVTITVKDNDRRGTADADVMNGDSGNNRLEGLAGDDRLSGAAGNDWLDGGAGNDVLDGGLGADHMVGGAGSDIYIVDNINDVVVEAAGGGLDSVEASVSYRLPDNVEVLRLVNLTTGADGYGNGSDNLISAETVSGPLPVWGNIRLFGEGGNDQLVGSRFADMLDGGTGDDIMMGGLGDDLYIVDSLKDVVVEAARGGTDHVNTAISYTLSANVEWLTLTGSGNIRGTGNQLDNVITGNDGNNVLAGQLGDDTLNGMAGDDILIPDTGNNIVDGGEGTDMLLLLGVKSSYNYLEANGAIYLVGEEGATRMTGVETVRFADGMLATADLKAGLAAFDGLRYAASYSDLAAAFGTDATAATNHYISTGFAEGRDAKAFDPLDYIAGYSDLIAAFGTNAAAGTRHYLTAGRLEGRTDERFSGLDYAASYPTLAAQFGADEEAATRHYIQTGRAQGLSDSGFDALQYAASYKDLAALFGTDTDAATRHYLQFGRAEGRSADAFDGLRYIASNADLIVAIGSDDDGAAAHFLRSGFAENRPTTSFDALKYAAANPDVAAAFGSDVEALTEHYIDHGYYEHRALAPAAAMVEVIG